MTLTSEQLAKIIHQELMRQSEHVDRGAWCTSVDPKTMTMGFDGCINVQMLAEAILKCAR